MSINEPMPRDMGLPYMAAIVAMRSNIAHEQQDISNEATRVARLVANSAQINAVALASLLIAKGIITVAEYQKAVRLWANEEVATYLDRAGGEPN
jgi:hypothetical protein